MPNPFFAFKQFTIYHDRCAMKVGTDGVLLGAWTDVSSSKNVLDIGTGTGLISLMIAQRNDASSIVAIDIDDAAASQAKENVSASPWKERITVINQDICLYQPSMRFDTIVSNPPFFIDSLKCPDGQRNTARHTDTLPIQSLLRKGGELLSNDGAFSIIIPYDQSEEIIRLAEGEGLYLVRHTQVVTRPGLPPKRSLLTFRKTKEECKNDELTIELDRHVYTDEYIALTKDFYLKM